MVTGSADLPTESDSENLEVRLLGGLEVRAGGEAIQPVRSARARSLLAFLILHPDVAHARQRVAFQFWPDSPEGQARTNLRNVLHTLRRIHPAFEEALRVTTTTLRWQPPEPAVIDVERFARAADLAMAADPDDADDVIARCRDALALYAGDLLEGDDDDWLDARRSALRDQYRDVLHLLATALIDAGRAAEATAVTRQLVQVDPVSESGHRLRIEAHQAAGDRAGAVRAYHECAATLEREIGVEPGPATAAAYAAVLGSHRGGAVVPREVAARAQPALVGREEEWEQLVTAWEAAEHGPPSVVLLTGEPGIGKTRLVDELRAWCARAGAAVGEARSYATEGDLGYGIVTSWLRSPDMVRGLRQLAPEERAELARLLPELGSPGPVEGSDDADRRRRLFTVAAKALMGTGRPTLLVADDSQWSDQVSHEFIHYFIRQPTDVPLLVVLTARQDELDIGQPISVLRDGLVVLERLTELQLGRLSPEATGALGSQLAGTPLDDTAVEALFGDTEGNPLFVVETMRADRDGGGPAGTLSPRLRAVIDARFHRLSEAAATLLGAAAVVRRPSSANLLAMLCGLDDRSLARGLDELWRRGILRETGADAYEFSHGKLRDAAYENLSPPIRRSYHGAIAQVLAERAGGDPDVASSQVAVHFEAASRPEEAVAWFHQAALDAHQVAAYAEALRLLDRALALVSALPADVRHVRELELLSSMPLAIGGAEGYGTHRMHEAHQRVTDVAARLGVALEPSVMRSMVMSALCRDEFDAAGDAAGQLLAHATRVGDAALEVESHYLLGISAFWGARLGEAGEHFESVIANFDSATRARHQEVYGHDPHVVCLSRMANTLWFLGEEDDARRTCEAALALADEVGHPLSQDTAAIFACLLAVDLHDYDLLRRVAPRLGALGMNSLPFATKREAIAGLVDVLDGKPRDGIDRTLAALEQCGGQNFYPGFQAAIIRILLAAQAYAGDSAGGIETCDRALAMGSTPLWEAEVYRARAEFLHASGADTAEVDAHLQKAVVVARRQAAAGHLARIEATSRGLSGASPAAS